MNAEKNRGDAGGEGVGQNVSLGSQDEGVSQRRRTVPNVLQQPVEFDWIARQDGIHALQQETVRHALGILPSTALEFGVDEVNDG